MHGSFLRFPIAEADSIDIVIACVVLIIIVGLGAAGVFWLRKYFWGNESDAQPAAPSGFTLSDLRQHHREGRLTDEEFEKAKLKVVEAAKRVADRQIPNPQPPRARQPRPPAVP